LHSVAARGRRPLCVGTSAATFEKFERSGISRARRWRNCDRSKGVGRDKAIALKAAFTLASECGGTARESPTLILRSSGGFAARGHRFFDVEHSADPSFEHAQELIRIEKISQGTLDSILVHRAEVFNPAIYRQRGFGRSRAQFIQAAIPRLGAGHQGHARLIRAVSC